MQRLLERAALNSIVQDHARQRRHRESQPITDQRALRQAGEGVGAVVGRKSWAKKVTAAGQKGYCCRPMRV